MIFKEFWERFKNEKIAVNCQTEDEAKDFVRQCYDNGVEWGNANCNETYYKDYKSKTCYEYHIYVGLLYDEFNYYKYNEKLYSNSILFFKSILL